MEGKVIGKIEACSFHQIQQDIVRVARGGNMQAVSMQIGLVTWITMQVVAGESQRIFEMHLEDVPLFYFDGRG